MSTTRMTRRFLVAAAAATALVAGTAEAGADQVHYHSVHPHQHGDGMCHIDLPHVHVYAPAPKQKPLYQVRGGVHVYVGDPVAHGWDGPTHSYYGHHPVTVEHYRGDMVVYCYIDGPHYHEYEPPVDFEFEAKGGAYWYVGTYPKAYVRGKKRHARINVYLEPITYERPVVVVEPPPRYRGPIVRVHAEAGRGHGPPPHAAVRGKARVRGGVEVHVPAPTVEIGIGVGVGGVRDHRHGHVHRKHKKHKKHRKHRKHKKHRKHRKHRGWR